MLVAAALLIATTIRLSAFSRRRELGIMRLVGASNRFIQTPFVLEGVFAGLIGSLLAGGAVVAIVQFFVQGYLAQSLSFTFVDLSDALLVVPLLIVRRRAARGRLGGDRHHAVPAGLAALARLRGSDGCRGIR